MTEIVDALARLRFRHPWRPYQARVLDAIDAHVRDNKLHIVAAPGSGKTILGLEIVRRLGRPALILAPTVTIRDQWLERLALFLPDGELARNLATTEIDAPGWLTCATYQALHARFRQAQQTEEESEALEAEDSDAEPPSADDIAQLGARLRNAGVRTIILDEAHHLRREWWRVLDRLVHLLDDVTLVSLTATPPFDVVGREWQRYESLAGPIDEEISVPELIKTATLAPHQDYVFAVAPDDKARTAARDYDAAVENWLAHWRNDKSLIDAVRSHLWIARPEEYVEAILEAPEVAVSMLVLLRAVDEPFPESLMTFLATDAEKLPELSRRWWQVLIRSYLFDDHWPPGDGNDAHRAALKRHLRAEGLLYARELRIDASKPVGDCLALSPAKIDACVEIHALERRLRGDTLRQVVLSDYIRDDCPPRGADARLGAWPIFAALVEAVEGSGRDRLALLTGRLSLLHKSRVDDVRAALSDGADALMLAPFDRHTDFVKIETCGGTSLVPALTALLARGAVDTLVGTRSLLGEGWDAPAVNSLVLASHVGSFVTTNQMRGRAIRKDPADAHKAASIWHLIANDPETEAGRGDAYAFADRANAFVGLHASKPVIESGVARLELPEPWSESFVESLNAEMRDRIGRIDGLAARWREAIERGAAARVLPAVCSAPYVLKSRKLLVSDTLARLFVTGAAAGLGPIRMWAEWVARGGPQGDLRMAGRAFAIAACLAFVLSLPGLYRAVRALIRCYPVDGAIRRIGLALRDALHATGRLTTPPDCTDVVTSGHGTQGFSVALTGGTYYEASLFADCLRELLAPIENPRYLIVRRGRRWWGAKEDYHAVPSILGERKEPATALLRAWRSRVGPADLIYTRNMEGRRKLLKARVRAFSSVASDEPRRVDQWC